VQDNFRTCRPPDQITTQLKAFHVLTVPFQVQYHTVQLLLLQHDGCDAAEGCHSSTVQPTVGPGSIEHIVLIEDAVLVVICCTVPPHCQQAGVW
jgi:hypothetical protein